MTIDAQQTESSVSHARVRLAYGLLRLPGLLLIAFTFRGPALDVIEKIVGLGWITEFVISLCSAPASRALVAAILAATLFTIGWLAARGRESDTITRYGVALSISGALILILLSSLGSSLKWSLPALLLLATNWAPDSLFARAGVTARGLSTIVAAAPGVSEILLTDRYWSWLRGQTHRRLVLPGALAAAGLIAATLNISPLVGLERALRGNDDLRIVAVGDFNGLALGREDRYLFANGHGADRLLRFDTRDLDAPPVRSQDTVDWAQGLVYLPTNNEIFVFRPSDQRLLGFDGDTMALVQSIDAQMLSPGDPWVVHDAQTDRLALVSEADIQIGYPFLVFDRRTGVLLASRTEDPGNLIDSPTTSHLYMSFFRRGGRVMSFDMGTLEMTATAEGDPRMERLAYDPINNEILVTSPANSRIWRYDPDTLDVRGAFPAIFGVRVIAIDEGRAQMLVGSIATGKIALMDMATRKILRSWYVGPWLRSIALSPERGMAYITSNGWLYELDYVAAD